MNRKRVIKTKDSILVNSLFYIILKKKKYFSQTFLNFKKFKTQTDAKDVI